VSYARPGFFADPKLSQKVSTTAAGFGTTDTTHEKVQAKLGAIYYAQDEDGVVYEITVKERDASGVGLEVRRAGGAQ
jgi:hypothetical protein